MKRKTLSPLSRKSARLQSRADVAIKPASIAHLPSPTSTVYKHTPGKDKRKIDSEQSIQAYPQQRTHERRKTTATTVGPSKFISKEASTAYWASHHFWPKDFATTVAKMASEVSSKRRSSSTHESKRIRGMEQYNIYMHSQRPLHAESKKLCNDLLKGDRKPPAFPMYPENKRQEVVDSMATEPEAVIQTYITPIVIPTVAVLRWYKRITLNDSFGDEMNALWTKADTMGHTQPKPDYVAGLREKAFDSATWDKLNNYATPATPVFVTGIICYPMLIGEVKSPWAGMQVAGEQSTHAAVIAVKQQFSLYWTAYGEDSPIVDQLYGQVLVFSICHNNNMVEVFAHYALPKQGRGLRTEQSEAGKLVKADSQKIQSKKAAPSKKAKSQKADPKKKAQSQKANSKEVKTKTLPSLELEFYRKQIGMWSLTMNDGRDQDQAYSFVEHLHETFSPTHLKRIRAAAELLPEPGPKTSLSFGTGQLSIGSDSQETELKQGNQEILANDALIQELAAVRTLMEQQRADFKLQLEQSQQREEKQMAESKAREEKLRSQLDKLMEMLSKNE